MWHVLENGKPAKYIEGQHKYWQDWSKNSYETLEQAVKYLRQWGGQYLRLYKDYEMIKLFAGPKPRDYNGFDTFHIIWTED